MKSGFLYSSLVDWLSDGNIFQYFSMNETLRKKTWLQKLSYILNIMVKLSHTSHLVMATKHL